VLREYTLPAIAPVLFWLNLPQSGHSYS